ncbi:MAG: sulfatase-like hydrolase/transferase [Spirochaetes bacterium]|nr:sulfatase-like hydrolase/transferase [Spirochaetota bacterium]
MFTGKYLHHSARALKFVLLCASAVFAFRIILFGLISSSYSDADIVVYFIKSIPYDLLFLSCLFILSFSYLLIFGRQIRIFEAVLFIPLALIFVFYAGYYSVFEKYFQVSALGEGLSTYSNEIINSAFHEIGAGVYISLFLFTAMFALYFFTVKYIKRILHSLLLYFILPLLFFGITFSIISAPKDNLFENPDYSSVSKNPVFFLFSSMLIKPAEETIISNDSKGELYLNTDSINDPGIVPDLKIPKKKYNIIFYFFESTSQKYTDLKVNGKPVMPVWERLSQNSINFTRHYAHYPLSVNALYNVFSSTYNPLKKMWIPMHDAKIPYKSATEIFKENGYRTALLHSGDLRNFNHIGYLKERKIDLILDIKTLKPGKYKVITPYSLDDRVMIKPLVDFANKEKDKPFFAALFPLLPHHPYTFPFKEYFLYSETEIAKAPGKKEKTWMQYINSLHFSDQCLGELIDSLDKNGLLENTLIFVFADHGEAFYQHPGNYLHAIHVYDENVHVPFIIYGKNIIKRKIDYPSVSSHVDILPTALDLAGIKPEEYFQGTSLIAKHSKRMAFSYTDWDEIKRSVRDGKWKYILSDAGKEELYDTDSDAGENKNLAAEFPELTVKFKDFLINAAQHQREFYKSRKYKNQ